jgi:hypothetical protein
MSIRYSCPFRSSAGVCEVIVQLSEAEAQDLQHHRALGKQAGSANGPLAKYYAWNRAARMVPPEFAPIYEQARLVN